jgi:AcrR family transcriptional regulator
VSPATISRTPTRKQVLTDMRRREILSAAVKVFGKKGFAATCVGDIAEAAKIAKGTVYLYFDSKEEIYATAVQRAVAQLHELAAERIESVSGVRARLCVAISVRMEFWSEQRSLYRLLLTVGREPRHRRQTHEVMRSGQASLLAIMQEGEAAGEIEERDFEMIAWAILDLIRGANERRLDNLTARTPQQDAAAITGFALHLLGLPGESPSRC